MDFEIKQQEVKGSDRMPLLSTPKIVLLSQSELADDRAVTLDISLLQIVQKVSSVTDHLLKTAAAVEILLVGSQVLGQVVDTVGEDCDLNLGRTGVSLVSCVLLNNAELFFLLHGFYSPFFKFGVSLSIRWVNNRKAVSDPLTELTSYNSIIPHFSRFVKRFFKLFYYIMKKVFERGAVCGRSCKIV